MTLPARSFDLNSGEFAKGGRPCSRRKSKPLTASGAWNRIFMPNPCGITYIAICPLPFSVTPPELEWSMRNEIQLLKTRLEKDIRRRIGIISLADLLWQAVD